MNSKASFRLIRFGSAKALTQAHLPFGEQESMDVSDCWGV